MVFSSHIFLFYFLPLALAASLLVPRRLWLGVLAVFSYAFYGWANPAFMLLMMFSTLVDYVCGLWLAGEARRRLSEGTAGRTVREKLALWISIVTNLSLLGFFKYFNFAAENYKALTQHLGWAAPDFFLEVTLPLGISFYTFQSMSYTIDIYRGEAKAMRSFAGFAAYVSMFPQLVAGPIVRFQTVARQLRRPDRTWSAFARGAACFSLGLGKKVLLANPCGKVADLMFGTDSAGMLESWIGMFAYSFQIYFDFSGYSDMAIGLGLMLGFRFPINFNSPYRAHSITDFWQRWHISLSTWLRDYLYIPLGGSRRGDLRTYANLLTVMFLGGLWHGASWNFVIWGSVHGVLLAVERAMPGRSLWARLPRLLQVSLTFTVVSLAWVLFRAPDLAGAMDYYARLAGLGHGGELAALMGALVWKPLFVATMILAALVVWFGPTTLDWSRHLTAPKAVWSLAVFWGAALMLSVQKFNPFIYFIF
ncbi:MAG: MBOAT family protein [Chthoniobacterales bacterium]|nr:MBOAT family protein [Chthoniobacterales bacterium]